MKPKFRCGQRVAIASYEVQACYSDGKIWWYSLKGITNPAPNSHGTWLESELYAVPVSATPEGDGK